MGEEEVDGGAQVRLRRRLGLPLPLRRRRRRHRLGALLVLALLPAESYGLDDYAKEVRLISSPIAAC